MSRNLRKIIEHENINWSRVFNEELSKKCAKRFSSFWWERYYKEIVDNFNDLIHIDGLKNVLEAGSGSGKATLLLDEKLCKTLLDISSIALEYAKYVANIFNVKDVNYIEGNIFLMPLKDNSYDLVWSIGVIEHYNLSDVNLIIKEMVRVSSKSGIVAVGMPNYYSGPTLKARLLKFLKYLPGYKLNTEKFYKPSKIEDIFECVSKDLNKRISYIETRYFGSPLIMETPKFILATLDPLISRLFKKNKFLIMVICKFE